jgi:hypothetical protein
VQAQNTNITETSKTTVTTVKDSDGEKKVVKEQKTQEAQDIKFKETKGDPLNRDGGHSVQNHRNTNHQSRWQYQDGSR